MNGKLGKFAIVKVESMNPDIVVSQLKDLFRNEYGHEPVVTRLNGGGSSRRYYRLKYGDLSLIGAFCEDIAENECFLSLTRIFGEYGIKVPRIVNMNRRLDTYLMQDLGDVSLLERLKSEDRIALSRLALAQLVKLQNVPEGLWCGNVRHGELDERLVMWDLNYFKYDFLKASGIDFDENLLEDDFIGLRDIVLDVPEVLKGFMYRDFQSRNIMVKDGNLYFIDYQGGRKGPVVYDLVSFLWQAKASFDWEEREELIRHYAELMARTRGIDESMIAEAVMPFALFRTLQVLGAYGLRGLIERKPHFLESIPYGVRNLKELRERGALSHFPEITRICEKLESIYIIGKEIISEDVLTVTVGSFSYRKGYPLDRSGNGGGFIFDCRGLPNPGRYEEYKELTGLDVAVADYLKEKKEVSEFVRNCGLLVNQTVDNYLERGFNSLQVWFGCTGGRHRSVYCAESLAEKLAERGGSRLKIRVIHREQEIYRQMKIYE